MKCLEKIINEYHNLKCCSEKYNIKHSILEKWIRRLSCREYSKELTVQEEEQLKKEGLVVVFGANDDLCQIRGAISDKIRCSSDKTIFYVEKIDSFISKDYYKTNHQELTKIDLYGRPYLKINSMDGLWRYDISKNVYNLEFNILEGEKIYCIGKIFFKEDFIKNGGIKK